MKEGRSAAAGALRSLRGLVPLAVVLLFWQYHSRTHSPSTPPPSEWWTAFKHIEGTGVLWTGLWVTLKLYVEGLVAAIVLGTALGVAWGSSRRLLQALSPLLEFLRATPAAAVVPVAILLFHATKKTEIGIVVYGSIWPILLNTAAARSALPPLRLDMAHSLRLSWFSRFRKVVLPSLLPAIMVSVRVAAPIALIVTILVDFLMATGGIGYLLIQYEQSFQSASSFALLALVGVVGILNDLLLTRIERTVLHRWPAGG